MFSKKNMFSVIVQQKIDNYQKSAHKTCQCKKTILKLTSYSLILASEHEQTRCVYCIQRLK